MKTIIKLTLVLSIYSSLAFAGDMGGGGYQCPPEGCTPPPCEVDCTGGFAQIGGDVKSDDNSVYSTTDLAVDTVMGSLEFLF